VPFYSSLRVLLTHVVEYLQPFIDSDQPILKYLPDPYYAIAVPVCIGVVAVIVITFCLGALLAYHGTRELMGASGLQPTGDLYDMMTEKRKRT
jgi:hypothetical protein